jgi:UDP-N-acetylglucosamine--N-acetylmuramyl-(pentapeptide) pyrophosphoryl-undecaprenol N-acetylglucosamine transferase
MKKIIFTGGGSGGHVMPALSLIKKLNQDHQFDIHYIGGINSIERDLVKDYQLNYHPIHTGKLRRYLSIENMKDVFKIFLGFLESLKILLTFKRKECLIFSTGGFVSVPVVIAGKCLGFKIYIHEQTSRVGLANKICSIMARKVFISFEESFKYFDRTKTYFSGYPLREECFSEAINEVIISGINLNHVTKPILFVTGGGNGAKLINDLIKRNFEILTTEYFIVHQVGKVFLDEFKNLKNSNYLPLAFIGPEMIDIYKLASITLSRSGAGTVCELIAIGKKSIFIPLKIAQKNEQFYNAVEAKNKLGSIIIEEKNLTDDLFLSSLKEIGLVNPIKKVQESNGLDILLNEIKNAF